MAEDDKELFESAFQDGAIEPEKVETPEPAQQERPRDEHGRFATKAQEEAPEPAPEPEKPEPKTEGIPSWRLKEEAEARRAAEERASRVERELADIRRQLQSTQKPAEPDKPAPEIWDDPNGFVQAALTPVQQALQQQAERFSMRMAVKEYGKDTVQAAYAALGTAMQAGDPSARAEYQRIKQSDDPYEDIVQWHKRSQTLQKVGDDPEKWLEARLEERLKDPTYQAQLLERIRGTAQQQPQQRPVTQLPPSLNRATRAAPSAEDDDNSDAGLLKSALRR